MNVCRATFRAWIEADVSELVFGKVLRVSDLAHDDKIEFITEANQPVAHITTVKEEVAAGRGCGGSGRCGCSG